MWPRGCAEGAAAHYRSPTGTVGEWHISSSRFTSPLSWGRRSRLCNLYLHAVRSHIRSPPWSLVPPAPNCQWGRCSVSGTEGGGWSSPPQGSSPKCAKPHRVARGGGRDPMAVATAFSPPMGSPRRQRSTVRSRLEPVGSRGARRAPRQPSAGPRSGAKSRALFGWVPRPVTG